MMNSREEKRAAKIRIEGFSGLTSGRILGEKYNLSEKQIYRILQGHNPALLDDGLGRINAMTEQTRFKASIALFLVELGVKKSNVVKYLQIGKGGLSKLIRKLDGNRKPVAIPIKLDVKTVDTQGEWIHPKRYFVERISDKVAALRLPNLSSSRFVFINSLKGKFSLVSAAPISLQTAFRTEPSTKENIEKATEYGVALKPFPESDIILDNWRIYKVRRG